MIPEKKEKVGTVLVISWWFHCIDVCVRRFDEEKFANEWEEFVERKFDDESLSRGKCFQECLGPGSRFSSTTREQKTTGVKRKQKAGQVSLTRVDATRRDVTWRDVTLERRDASRWDGHPPWIPCVASHASTLCLHQLPCQDNQSGNRWVIV